MGTSSRNSRLAWLVVVTELVLIALAAYFTYLSHPLPSQSVYRESWQANLIRAIPAVAYLVNGLLIVIRLQGNRFGWLLIGFSFSLGGWMNIFASYGLYLYTTTSVPLRMVGLMASLAAVGWISMFACLVFILLLFPTGNYLSRHWRIIGWLTFISIAIALIVVPFQPGTLAFIAQIENPLALKQDLGQLAGLLSDISFGILVGCLFMGVLSIIFRLIGAKGVERQQIKWFAYAAFLLGLWLSFDMVTELPQPWESMKESAFLTMPPLAIGIAILRYRLWDIDFVIRKTLIYGALSLSLALIYFGSVLLLQALFLAITGQGRSPIAAVISTLAIAALFTPLRRRIQNDIDRRFYRQKYDARRIAEEFATRARDEVELDVLTGHLIESVEKTLQPDHVSLWLRKGKG